MKKCEIEKILIDADEAQMGEISDFFATKLGKAKPPDTTAVVLEKALDQAAQGWEERDGRFVCKDTCKGRLCMRADLVKDPVAVKKSDTSVENLLTPNTLRPTDEEKAEAAAWDAIMPKVKTPVADLDPAWVREWDKLERKKE